MSLKLLPLLGAVVLAAPAHAVSINMSDFSYAAPTTVNMQGTGGSPSYDGQAGRFNGSSDGGVPGSDLLRFGLLSDQALSTSFVAWCAELTQTFNFGVTYDYTLVSGLAHFGATKNDELSRLFTAAQGFVVDNKTSAALQAGIWEIIYEQGPTLSLTSGTFQGGPEDPSAQGAFDTVNGFLAHLSDYAALAQIDVLENSAQQDFLVATIPEPETWLLMIGGFGLIAASRRRRMR
jgi:hypothetical protein